MKYHMLIACILLDRFLNKNTRYYDMHGIATTRVVNLCSPLLDITAYLRARTDASTAQPVNIVTCHLNPQTPAILVLKHL